MEYREFTEKVREKVSEIVTEDFEVKLIDVAKNNSVNRVGIVMREKDSNVSPTIYLERFFSDYTEGKVSMDDIAHEILRIYSAHRDDIPFDTNVFKDWEWVKNNVCYKLVSKEKNKELLEKVPHRSFLDLAVIYYVPVSLGDSVSSILVRNEHLEFWGKSERTLNTRSKLNTPRIMSEICFSISDFLGTSSFEIPMYVLSNKYRVNGASVMMYSDYFEKLSKSMESDLIVLPSSIHEVIVCPSNDFEDMDYIRNMVMTINSTEVSNDEILSDSVYRYSRESGSMKVVA